MVKENGRNQNSLPDLTVPIEATYVANICAFGRETVEMDTSQKAKTAGAAYGKKKHSLAL